MSNCKKTAHGISSMFISAINTGKGAVFAAALLLITGFVIVGCQKDTHPGHDSGHEQESKHSDEHGHEGDHHESEVELTEEARKAAGIEIRDAVLEPLTAPIEATAVIEMNGDRMAKISATTSGKLMSIAASQGDSVRAGQALAWFDSPELGQASADYLKSRGRVEVARKNLQREEALFEKKISPEKDVIRARQELNEAEEDLSFAEEKFHLLGVEIDQVRKERGSDHPLIAVTSPIRGTVIERTASQGEVVNPEKTLFLVADLSTLWVLIDIYEKDLSRIKPGTAVRVRTAAYPDKSFKGVISYIGDIMDEHTRTVKARVVVENANRLLKPGMFCTVSIDARSAQAEKAILIAEEAILMDGNERFVFVHTDEDLFERKEIRTGRTFGKKVEVVEGLSAGDRVVVKGAFALKSELKKAELSEDAHGH